MIKLFQGITDTAAQRMSNIAGSFSAMNEAERLAFTTELRAQRKRGASARAVKAAKEKADAQEGESVQAGSDQEDSPAEGAG